MQAVDALPAFTEHRKTPRLAPLCQVFPPFSRRAASKLSLSPHVSCHTIPYRSGPPLSRPNRRHHRSDKAREI